VIDAGDLSVCQVNHLPIVSLLGENLRPNPVHIRLEIGIETLAIGSGAWVGIAHALNGVSEVIVDLEFG
jgi:hypothetical protein